MPDTPKESHGIETEEHVCDFLRRLEHIANHIIGMRPF